MIREIIKNGEQIRIWKGTAVVYFDCYPIILKETLEKHGKPVSGQLVN
jgi:hypothetical protein